MRLGGRAAERFTIQRCLGRGGMGVVYEAYDHDRKVLVALKTLEKTDPAALLRFKQEFRALTEVSHPNLVGLDELFSSEDQWFFTMELIRGSGFLEHVRPASAAGSQDTPGWAEQPTMDTAPAILVPESLAATAGLDGGVVDVGRLRAATAQLAGGIHALHQSGRLHRDVKPSNVLVEEGGRVVLCDFGLVSHLAGDPLDNSIDQRVAGTVAYMSPEQAGSRQLTEASDWYAVGVMLFHALTGRVPFVGKSREVLRAKQESEAPDPRVLAPTVPGELAELVGRLLARDPQARPGARELLEELGADAERATTSSVSERREVFVGREQHVAGLWRAFASVREGACRAIFLRGRFGMGKTAVARRFLTGVRDGGQALVLAGRCYEREHVPYKALDGVIDALTQHLARLPRSEVDPLVPPNAVELERLFPVLSRVPGFQSPPPTEPEPAVDPQKLRRRAFQALRVLVTRLASRAPLVLFIDDLQWSDADGLALLSGLLRRPGPERVMLVATYREEDAGSPDIRALVEELGPEQEDIEVGPLSSTESDALARSLLGGRSSDAQAVTVASESGGNPLFVAELAHFARHHTPTGDTADGAISLETALRRRIEALPPSSRALLEVVSVAGRPLPREVLRIAASLGEDEARALAALRADHLVRTTRHGDEQLIEAYHDRIRENMVALLDGPGLARRHRQLAGSLEAGGQADTEVAAEHWLGAGETDKAARLAVRVARSAAQALAFDRAARLLRLALTHGTHDAAERGRLQFELGEALAHTGRAPVEAADAYLAAASDAEPGEAMEARRRAAAELLRSGHLDRGRAVLEQVLAAVGMRLAPTPMAAIRSLLWRRGQLRLRGMGFVPRDPATIPAEELRLVDTTWSVSMGLGIVDNLRASVFQSVNLLQALRAGDPARISRAMGMEACYLATTSGTGAERARKLLSRARELAEGTGQPRAIGEALLATSVASYCDARWRQARDNGMEAVRVLGERCTGAEWERNTALVFSMMGRLYLGELPGVFAEYPEPLREAEERQDRYAAHYLRMRVAYLHALASDDVERARAELDRARTEWTFQGVVHMQQYFQVYAEAQIQMYAGQPRRALATLAAHWRPFEKAFLLRIATAGALLRDARARAALGAATADAPDRAALLAQVRHDAGWLLKSVLPCAPAYGALLMAGHAARTGNHRSALEWLALADERFDAMEMPVLRHCARYRRATLLPAAAGVSLRADSTAWLTAHGVASPARYVELVAPGFG